MCFKSFSVGSLITDNDYTHLLDVLITSKSLSIKRVFARLLYDNRFALLLLLYSIIPIEFALTFLWLHFTFHLLGLILHNSHRTIFFLQYLISCVSFYSAWAYSYIHRFYPYDIVFENYFHPTPLTHFIILIWIAALVNTFKVFCFIFLPADSIHTALVTILILLIRCWLLSYEFLQFLLPLTLFVGVFLIFSLFNLSWA